MPSAGKLRHRIHLQRRADAGELVPEEPLATEDGLDLLTESGETLIVAEAIETGGPGDPYGNPVAGPFETIYTVWGALRPKLGSEQVLAARLTGVQPYTLTVRNTTQTRQVNTDWIAVDARDGRVFNIRSVVDPDQRRQFLEMVVQQGVAV